MQAYIFTLEKHLILTLNDLENKPVNDIWSRGMDSSKGNIAGKLRLKRNNWCEEEYLDIMETKMIISQLIKEDKLTGR